MCGFAGQLIFNSNYHREEYTLQTLNMINTLNHRGPDDDGKWSDPNGIYYVGHKRLSIIDTSEAGSQPMISSDGRFILVFNGEIYNHLEIRSKLFKQGIKYPFQGHSDTETLLAILINWDLEKCLFELNGMFAFSFWDRREKVLICARDRFGEKPLYYGFCGNRFIFGSELKALTSHPLFKKEIDQESLELYLRYSYIPSPKTIFKNIHKLKPANFFTLNYESKVLSEPKCYWDTKDTLLNRPKLTEIGEKEIINELEARLITSTKLRMQSDVPLGAFLSGGIDSSLITSLMQSLSSNPINTFTIGFNDSSFNEANKAKNIAYFLGTNHTELYCTEKELIELIPNLSYMWDEPFADSSQIPTALLSSLTSKKVKVALSGDGGDEFFCGYNRYSKGYRVFKNINNIPFILKNLTRKTVDKFPDQLLIRLVNLFLPNYKFQSFSEKKKKLLNIFKCEKDIEFYKELISCFSNPSEILLNYQEIENPIFKEDNLKGYNNFIELMMYLDSVSYLPDDILTKIDRATMSYGLEARCPFLDHNLIEWASSIPLKYKYKDGLTKWPLRKLLEKYVPSQLWDYSKMGFAVPMKSWINGQLKDWTMDLLNQNSVKDQGIFCPKAIENLLEDHYGRNVDSTTQIWNLIMFQSWYGQL
jgi:asparagine synthase (glutamine-hydrolysing)